MSRLLCRLRGYNAFIVYRRELAPGTVSLTGYRAQGDDSQHCAYCTVKSFPVLAFNVVIITIVRIYT